MSSTRPASVVVVTALTWIAAALDVIAGAAMVWLSFTLDPAETAISAIALRWYGSVSLAVGALTAAVARGLGTGSQGARVLVMIVMTLRIVAAGYALLAVGGFSVWQALGQIVAAMLAIALLSTRRASDFYRRRNP